MEKNIAALMREDTRTVHVSFGPFPDDGAEQIVAAVNAVGATMGGGRGGACGGPRLVARYRSCEGPRMKARHPLVAHLLRVLAGAVFSRAEKQHVFAGGNVSPESIGYTGQKNSRWRAVHGSHGNGSIKVRREARKARNRRAHRG